MSNDNDLEMESLGALLKRARDSKKQSIEQVSTETKISVSNLRAMENDDYDNLPAIPFARGFYGLYAKYLEIDPDEITARFLKNIGRTSTKTENLITEERDYSASSQSVSTMAERSSGSPVSTFGFILLLLIILTGALCYYFQINPAAYLSNKLRGFQETEISETVSSESNSSDSLQNQ